MVSKDKWDIDAIYIPEIDFDFKSEVDRLKKVMDTKDGVNIFLSEGAGLETITREMESNGEVIPRDAFGHVKLDEINPGQWFAKYFESNLLDLKDMLQKIWKQIPNERLGYVNGFDDIKKHSYFSKFLNLINDQGKSTPMAMGHVSPNPLLLELIHNSKTSMYNNDMLTKGDEESLDQQMFKGF